MQLDQKDFSFEIKAVNDDGFFSGYASVFGVVDSYGDVVAKGAFAESLAAWAGKGRLPALLWQHRMDEPIGLYTAMREDDVGLYVEGQLALKTMRGAETYELMKMKAISGLSIGYVTRDDSWDRVTDVRTLKKVDLWEASVVTMPANDSARIGDVKTHGGGAAGVKHLQYLIKKIQGM
ncbi:HK97 family phage prohead protease [Chromobacterium subtsugae]|uniref:HK97 family phage prohead protease n=1 Tax=Chromobacterium subtsugae TaxID=251747 RepID=UPI0006410D1F|nr:HK97 family phage prohead protease [Chromobacterium subtsugae]